jgi:chaperonin GroES
MNGHAAGPQGMPLLPAGAAAVPPPPLPPTLDRETAVWADQTNVPDGPDMAHALLLKKWINSPNIAAEGDDIAEQMLQNIATDVKREYEIDWNSCADYREKYEKWMKMALQDTEPKTFPWNGAANVIYPLITSAAIQFSARAYPAIVRDQNVVKGTVWGPDSDNQKQVRAHAIGQHMSWQLLKEQEEWEPQTDKLLLTIAIAGTMFRKSYFDPEMGRNMSETVTAMKLVVNFGAKSFETAPRVTELIELYPYQIEERIRAGIFLDEEYGSDIDRDAQDPDAKVTFLEQHRRLDLDQDGYSEPYIVTVARDSGVLARIVARFDLEGVMFGKTDHRVHKIDPVPYYTKYGFIPNPTSAIYDIGFGHLLYPLNDAINTTLNQMFDAGTLANAGGGFIGSGFSLNTGTVNFQVGEYKVVNSSGAALRENIVPLNFPGPNQTLFQLLQFLVECAKEVAQVKDVMVGDLPGDNVPATTMLAVIEQGLQVYSAIHKRIHRSLKQEFAKLFRLNRLYLDDQRGYLIGAEWHRITRRDYMAGSGVEPISDPRMLTDMQRMGRAQFLLQLQANPGINKIEVLRRVLDAAQIEQPEKLIVPPAPDPKLVLKAHELDIRSEREGRDLDLRSQHDETLKAREIAQTILFLAQARSLDATAKLAWVDHALEGLRFQLEVLNAAAAASSPSPGAPAPAGAAGPPQGPPAGGLPGMAPQPGVAGPVALPGGPVG